MFDKLVASEPKSADFRNRRRYFIASSLVVGVLFLAAVVASIFAADFGVGDGSFELAKLLPPVEMATVEPEAPLPRKNDAPASSSDETTRAVNMLNLQENPIVPNGISVTQNKNLARPNTDRFRVTGVDSPPANTNGSGRPADFGGNARSGLVQGIPEGRDTDPEGVPPRVVKKDPLRKPPVVSKGPLNGVALSLPKPNYSAAARAVRAQGKVTVQVTIDENGNVVSANAVDGHPMLRADAERAARNAKFSPTTLGGMAVKVTGVITYNFIL